MSRPKRPLRPRALPDLRAGGILPGKKGVVMMIEERREIRDGIEVVLFRQGVAEQETSQETTEVCVRVAEAHERPYTHAAIRLFFRDTAAAALLGVPIIRSVVDVVPFIGNAFSMVSFPIAPQDVAWVRVELMRSYGRLDFFQSSNSPEIPNSLPKPEPGLTRKNWGHLGDFDGIK